MVRGHTFNLHKKLGYTIVQAIAALALSQTSALTDLCTVEDI